MQFSDNVREQRKQNGFSQEYLAEKMGVSRQTISKWENGTAMPDLKKLTELADLFGTSMDELLGLSSAPNAENAAPATDAEEYRRHTESLVTAMFQNLSASYEKRINSTSRALAVITFAVLLIYFINFGTVNSKLSTLESRIAELQQQSRVVYEDRVIEPDINFEAKLTAVNKDKPYLLETKLTYSPDEYIKDSTVSFVLTGNRSGKSITLETENKDGVFTAEFEGDIREIFYHCTINVDDGERITRYEQYADMLSGEQLSGTELSYVNYRDGITVSCFSPLDADDAYLMLLHPILDGAIESGSINVEGENGEILYTNSLRFSKYKSDDFDNAYTAAVSPSTIKIPAGKTVKYIYVSAKDSYGTEYRIYGYHQDIGSDFAESPYSGSQVIIYTIDGKQTAISTDADDNYIINE